MKALLLYGLGILVAFSLTPLLPPPLSIDWQMSFLVGLAVTFLGLACQWNDIRTYHEGEETFVWRLRESPYLRGGTRFKQVVDYAFYGSSNAFGALIMETFYYNAPPRLAILIAIACTGLLIAAISAKEIASRRHRK